MAGSKSLLDLMPKEEAEKAIARANRRASYNRGAKVSPEIYSVAEFGYYFGWEAILAVKRGYIIDPVKNEKVIFTLDEMNVLLEGARKVWYSKLVEQGGVNTVSGSFKTQGNSYNEAMKPYTEKAELG
jgi:hypothetical protein